MKREGIIKSLRQYFKEKPISKVYLFGSYARNDADDSSDVDILVEIEKDYMMSFFEFGSILEDLKELLGSKVDLLSTDAVSKHIAPFINKEKLLVYER